MPTTPTSTLHGLSTGNCWHVSGLARDLCPDARIFFGEKIMCPPNSRVARLQLKSDPTKFEEGRRQGFLIAQLFD
jgi:hypothetical protein